MTVQTPTPVAGIMTSTSATTTSAISTSSSSIISRKRRPSSSSPSSPSSPSSSGTPGAPTITPFGVKRARTARHHSRSASSTTNHAEHSPFPAVADMSPSLGAPRTPALPQSGEDEDEDEDDNTSSSSSSSGSSEYDEEWSSGEEEGRDGRVDGHSVYSGGPVSHNALGIAGIGDDGEAAGGSGEYSTSSSSSSSSESSEGSYSSEGEGEDGSEQGQGTDLRGSESPDVAVLPKAIRKPAIGPMAMGDGSGSNVQERLAAFLPALKAANEKLEVQRASGKYEEGAMEKVADGEGYIEMNLGLGVLEEKPKGDKATDTTRDDDQRNSHTEDVMSILMGQQSEEGPSAGIEEVNDGNAEMT